MPTTLAPSFPDTYTLLTRPEAAALARVTVTTLDRWIAAGLLPVVRIGARRVMIRRSAMSAYLTAHDTAPTLDPEVPAPELDRAELLTYAEAIDALRLGRTTLDTLTAAGELPVMILGRLRKVRAGSLADLIDRHSHPATAGPLAGRTA